MAVGSTKMALVALACSAGGAAAKLAASVLTGSSALLASAIHSLVDGSNQALLLYGLGRTERATEISGPPASGRELYFWSFTVAILLYSLGAGVAIYEGVDKLNWPQAPQRLELGHIAVAAALALQCVSAWMTWSRIKGPSGEMPTLSALRAAREPATLLVVLQSTAALVGLALALAGILGGQLAGMAEADGIAAIAIGLVLAWMAATSAIEVKAELGRRPGAGSAPQPAAPALAPVVAPAQAPLSAASEPAAKAAGPGPQAKAPLVRQQQPKKVKGRRRRKR